MWFSYLSYGTDESGSYIGSNAAIEAYCEQHILNNLIVLYF